MMPENSMSVEMLMRLYRLMKRSCLVQLEKETDRQLKKVWWKNKPVMIRLILVVGVDELRKLLIDPWVPLIIWFIIEKHLFSFVRVFFYSLRKRNAKKRTWFWILLFAVVVVVATVLELPYRFTSIELLAIGCMGMWFDVVVKDWSLAGEVRYWKSGRIVVVAVVVVVVGDSLRNVISWLFWFGFDDEQFKLLLKMY